jgi:hypothetical protein
VQRPAATHELKPILAQRPPEVFYFLVAEGLVLKLKPSDMALAIREFRELTRRTAQHLRDDLGLEMPTGFTVPSAVPLAWLEKPVFESMDHYNYTSQVTPAISSTFATSLTACSLVWPQILPMLMEQFAEGRSPPPGDQVSLFLKHFTTPSTITPTNDHPRKQNQNSGAEGEAPKVTVLKVVAEAKTKPLAWRTEFSNDDLAKCASSF